MIMNAHCAASAKTASQKHNFSMEITRRNKMAEGFYIDDQAALYGFLCKSAEEICGAAGLEAAIEATKLYGKERGLRMAMRAMANGDSLTIRNYLAYGEWADHKNWSQINVTSTYPEYRTEVLKCGWHDTWKKYGLEKYGALYCSYIDYSLVSGFNPELKLEIDSFLTHGHQSCRFHWVGADIKNSSDLNALIKKKSDMSDNNIKDFLYHTGHLLSAMRRGFLYELGLVAGREITSMAMKEYAAIFGDEKAMAVFAESGQDFLIIY